MGGGVVQGHVVVQGRVNGACAQAQGDGAENQPGEAARAGEPKQSQGGEGRADGGHLVGAKAANHPGAEDAGNHRAAGDSHRDKTAKGDRQGELPIDGGPGRAEQGIGDAQATRSKVAIKTLLNKVHLIVANLGPCFYQKDGVFYNKSAKFYEKRRLRHELGTIHGPL